MTPYLDLPGALSHDDCAAVIAFAQAAQLRDAVLVGGQTQHGLRRADIAWLDDLPEGSWAMDRLTTLVARANRDSYGFDLTEFAESAQIARYSADRLGHFDWHSDIGKGPLAMRRKLTVVVQLSDPDAYEGGTLDLRPDSSVQAAPRAQGTAVIFPSFVLHRVTPVSHGTRWSLTLWAHGPAFR